MGVLWRGPDCEELVGVTLRSDGGLGVQIFHQYREDTRNLELSIQSRLELFSRISTTKMYNKMYKIDFSYP